MNTKTIKLSKCIIILAILILSFVLQSCIRSENKKNDDKLLPETYQNNIYIHYDRTELERETEYPFFPFGYDRCLWRENHNFITDGEISLMENDKNKNFLYFPSALGTVIYKKDTYEVPTSPSIENINEIMIVGLADEAKIITNKDKIKQIVEYMQSVKEKTNTSSQYDVSVYAVSDNDGGLFLLTNDINICIDEKGELYIDAFSGRIEIPKYVMNLLTDECK